MKKTNILNLKYLKNNFFLDGFLKLLEDQIKKDKDITYCILASCSSGKKNMDTLITQLYNEPLIGIWKTLSENGELLPKLSSNFKLTYKRTVSTYDQFMTVHILKSKINLTYYVTSYYMDGSRDEFDILDSFKSLKDAKKSV